MVGFLAVLTLLSASEGKFGSFRIASSCTSNFEHPEAASALLLPTASVDELLLGDDCNCMCWLAKFHNFKFQLGTRCLPRWLRRSLIRMCTTRLELPWPSTVCRRTSTPALSSPSLRLDSTSSKTAEKPALSGIVSFGKHRTSSTDGRCSGSWSLQG